MIIAFKSYVHEERQPNSIIHMIASMSKILYGQENIILQNNIFKHQLEYPVPKKEQRLGVEHLQLRMNALTKSMIEGTCTKELFIECSMILRDKSINYFVKEHSLFIKDYVKEQDKTIRDMISLAEQCYQNVYIDCGVEQNQFSRAILKESDLIFINVCLEEKNLSDLFLQYDFTNPNICLLIENEDDKKRKLSNYIFYTYPFLNANNTFFIPINKEFKSANSESSSTNLIYQHIYCEPNDKNYLFIQGIRNTAHKINEMAGKVLTKYEQKNFIKSLINGNIEVG